MRDKLYKIILRLTPCGCDESEIICIDCQKDIEEVLPKLEALIEQAVIEGIIGQLASLPDDDLREKVDVSYIFYLINYHEKRLAALSTKGPLGQLSQESPVRPTSDSDSSQSASTIKGGK